MSYSMPYSMPYSMSHNMSTDLPLGYEPWPTTQACTFSNNLWHLIGCAMSACIIQLTMEIMAHSMSLSGFFCLRDIYLGVAHSMSHEMGHALWPSLCSVEFCVTSVWVWHTICYIELN